MKNSKILFVITIIVVPIFCLATAVAGVFIGFGLTSAVMANSGLAGAEIAGDEVEAEILRIAADYAGSGDLEAAHDQLNALGLPNAGQYISFMVDR